MRNEVGHGKKLFINFGTISYASLISSSLQRFQCNKHFELRKKNVECLWNFPCLSPERSQTTKMSSHILASLHKGESDCLGAVSKRQGNQNRPTKNACKWKRRRRAEHDCSSDALNVTFKKYRNTQKSNS